MPVHAKTLRRASRPPAVQQQTQLRLAERAVAQKPCEVLLGSTGRVESSTGMQCCAIRLVSSLQPATALAHGWRNFGGKADQSTDERYWGEGDAAGYVPGD